jgi:hypothetical protein
MFHIVRKGSIAPMMDRTVWPGYHCNNNLRGSVLACSTNCHTARPQHCSIDGILSAPARTACRDSRPENASAHEHELIPTYHPFIGRSGTWACEKRPVGSELNGTVGYLGHVGC